MRVLVTGGAGFIGSNLCRRLIADGHDVTILDDLSTGSLDNLAGVDACIVRGSILDAALTTHLVHRADAVVHLAARPTIPRSLHDPALTNEVNVTGTINVLDGARTHPDAKPHVVFASSSSVYGANPALPKHEALQPMPISPYAASKLAGESYCLSYQACFGVPVTAFRLFNVFGPRQSSTATYAIPAFVEAARQGRPAVIEGDGTQTRDFTYVDNVTDAIARAVTARATSTTAVNLALGERRSLLDVIATLEDIVGHRIERDHRPPRTGDMRDTQADVSLLHRLLPLTDTVGFDDGLARTVAWYAEQADRAERQLAICAT